MSNPILNPEVAQSICNQYEAYKLFSKLTVAQQEEAIRRMGLTPEDEQAFRIAMAYMKLFCDESYRAAVEQAMGEALYEHFNRKEA